MRALVLVVACSGCCLSVDSREAGDQTTGIGRGGTGGGSSGGGSVGQTGGSATAGGGTGGLCPAGLFSLYVTPAQLDFGACKVNTTYRKSLTLVNCSNAPVNTITPVVEGLDANLFVVVDAPTAVAAGAQATVDISYSPLALEAQSLAKVIFTGDDGETASISLLGEPVGLPVMLSPNPLDFGYVPLDATAIACATVTNMMNVDLTIESITSFASDGNAFALAATDDATPPNPFALPLTIPGGDSAKVCFAFTPSISQQFQGQVTLVTHDPSGTNPILLLTGWGGGPQISCTPSTVEFGSVPINTSATIPIICTNTGTQIPGVNLTLKWPTASPGVFSTAFDQENNPYPLGGLPPGNAVQVDVSYAPSARASDKGTLVIESNAGKGKAFGIPLDGQGE